MLIPLIQDIEGSYSSKELKDIPQYIIEYNYIYILKDDKILKIFATLDKQIIKENFIKLIKSLDDDAFKIVDEATMLEYDFPIDMEYVGKYKLNKRRKTKNYKIPKYSNMDCSLIYILNSISNKVSLDCNDLWHLNNERQYYIQTDEKLSKVSLDVIEDIVSNLSIEVLDEYDYYKLSESLEYVEYIGNKEKLLSKMDLEKLRNILLDAEGNKDIFEELNINIELEEEYQKVK